MMRNFVVVFPTVALVLVLLMPAAEVVAWSSSSQSPPSSSFGTTGRLWDGRTRNGNTHNAVLRGKTKTRRNLSYRDDGGDGGNKDDSNNNDENDDIEFYDDFGGRTIGGSGSSSSSSSGGGGAARGGSVLKERIQKLQQTEIQKDATMINNWRVGNWKVRGFSLDPEPADADIMDENLSRTHVCQVVAASSTTPEDFVSSDKDNDIVWVGRTDGSVMAVRLGTEYWTKFRSKLTASADDNTGGGGDGDGDNESNMNIQISSELVREQEENDTPGVEKPFEIVHQCQAGDGNHAVSALLVTDEDEDDADHHQTVFTACHGSSDIRQWIVNDTDNDGDQDSSTPTTSSSMVSTVTMTGAHSPGSTIVAMKSVSLDADDSSSSSTKIMCSAADDGSLALWDMKSGDLLYKCQVAGDDDDDGSSGDATTTTAIRCADSDGKHIFVGTGTGQVLVFGVHDMMEAAASGNPSCPLPTGQWTAGTEGQAITSIACAGEGSLGRGRENPTLLFLTGDGNGVVRQWELLTRSNSNGGDGKPKSLLEQWPKLATQRLPKKAHMFEGHENEITCLKPIDSTKFLSASRDGTVVAWDPATGSKHFTMDGFTESINSLCYMSDDGLLITDGMKQYVCVHDFDVSVDIDKDYKIELDSDDVE